MKSIAKLFVLGLIFASHAWAGGAEVFATASNVFARATAVCYRHLNAPGAEQVRTNAQGAFLSSNDCSGFASYVLAQVAPRALAAVQAHETKGKHPHAKTYAEFFQGLATNRTASGWQTVASWRDLKAGDFIAWASRPATNSVTKKVTSSGHVAIVVEPPGAPQVETVSGKPERFVSVRVLDSSSVKHFAPEVFPPLAHQAERNGLGFGNIKLWLDDHDHVIGYWEGTWWGEGKKEMRRPSHGVALGFGRVTEN
ncbi:MAG: hypothetical protein NTY53_00575 [Kiritimatiellaeota bacterium]|nr:hypothetical protein [Kiritimatiellota bacterium]